MSASPRTSRLHEPFTRARAGRQRAYVLPLTLLLLTVAAASLAGVCRASFEKAVQAAAAREGLQRNWAITTCRAALLPRAERVIAGAASSETAPASEVRLHVTLGGMPLDLVFGDEQAKVNVNVLYRDGGRAGAERAVRELTLAAGADVRVALKPGAQLAEPGSVEALQRDDDGERAFENFSQVFEPVSPRALVFPGGAAERSAVAQLTCWGDGTLNFRRASVAALKRACPRSLGATGAARLVAIRQKEPDLEIWEVLEQLELSEEQQAEAEARLTDESSCHSLWIVARAAGRSWYDFSISDAGTGDPGGGATATFSW